MLKPILLVVSVSSAVSAALLAGAVVAAGAPHATAERGIERTLAVAGDAQIKVVPDRASFAVVLEVRDPDRARAQEKMQQRAAAFIAAVQQAGLAADGITLAQMALTPAYFTDAAGRPRYLQVREWTAVRRFTICVTDLSKMNAIFGALISTDATVDGDVVFDTSRLDEVRTTARRLAAQAARNKAAALVDTLGGSVGLPVTIGEADPSLSGGYTSKNAVEDWRNGAFADGAFSTGHMTVSAHVDVTFSIEG